jgi:hypothetical protein
MIANGQAATMLVFLQSAGLPDEHGLLPLSQIGDAPLLGALLDLPVQVLTASAYGFDDIRTPAHQMRALVRDVIMACRCAAASSDAAGQVEARCGVPDALSQLVATANLSPEHAQSLAVAMQGAHLPPGLDATVRRALCSAGVTHTPHGKR